MSELLAQANLLEGTQYYVPIVMVGLASYAFVKGYQWVRNTVKAELDVEVAKLKTEMKELTQRVRDLENGKSKAQEHMVLALDSFPKIPENEQGREHLRSAIRALNHDGSVMLQ